MEQDLDLMTLFKNFKKHHKHYNLNKEKYDEHVSDDINLDNESEACSSVESYLDKRKREAANDD
jgi:hypothetical protein